MSTASGKVRFQSVAADAGIATVARLAVPIWQECFTPIIGAAQVAYMLDAWQSVRAIRAQIQDGADYTLVYRLSEPIGYLALQDSPPGHCKLSKFYLLPQARGCGYGRQMMQAAIRQARTGQNHRLWLQVNRHNQRAIHFYQHAGFYTLREQRQDIGGGFHIDDFIMERPI